MTRSDQRILDQFLVAAARTGDRKSLGKLAQRWEAKLVRHAWRLTGDVEMARDAAQAAWLDITRGISGLSDTDAFPAWAFRIVTRRATDEIRRVRRRRAGAAALAAEPRDATTEDAAGRATPLHLALGRAMAGLSAEQRAAIALHYLDDLSIAEIATALRIPAGTVKTRLMAARDKLKLVLEERKETT